MMEASPVVFDLSSDDEEATSAWEEPKGDDYNWLSGFLEGNEKVFVDPDDLTVVGEVNRAKKSKSPDGKVAEEDDGDCVVLEGDPDKALSDVDDPQQDSDECLIVGQKGQIACRDFPHPRHDCAKFPFGSTSHEQHCEMCHCFVCDLPAPCSYWGSATSTADHCHASDKEVKWKTLRKTFRHGRNSPKPPLTSYPTAMPRRSDNMHYTLQNQVSRITATQAARNCIAQTHIQRPSIIHACSSTRYGGVPYDPSVGSQRFLNRRTLHPNPVSRLGVRNTVIRRYPGIKVSNFGPQFAPSNTMSKRMEVASTINHTAYAPSGNITSIASQHQWSPASVTISSERNSNPIGWPNLCSGSNLGTYTHPRSSHPGMVASASTNSAPSAYGQPVLQSCLNHNTNRLQNQNQPATNPAFSDYDLNWINNVDQSIQDHPVENVQLQNSTSEKEALKEINEGHKSVFNELENFLFDDQSFPDDSLAAGFNSLSSNHMSYDTGMIFFDIDTAWDRLTRA